MQERKVTSGGKTYQLDKPFFVLATQNPVEQEGTYPLPEAQTDRFMLKTIIDYPNKDEEKLIIRSNFTKLELNELFEDIMNKKITGIFMHINFIKI